MPKKVPVVNQRGPWRIYWLDGKYKIYREDIFQFFANTYEEARGLIDEWEAKNNGGS